MPLETLHEAYPGLYSQIERVTPMMNGHAHREPSARGFIPNLAVRIPDGLHVEFVQSPLSIRHIVARRTINDKRKTDWTFELRDGSWHVNGEPVTDAAIKSCLTYDGIEPAFM
jgi:hypothetical protein